MRDITYTTAKTVKAILESAATLEQSKVLQLTNETLRNLGNYVKINSAKMVNENPIYFEGALSEEQMAVPTAMFKFDITLTPDDTMESVYDAVELVKNQLEPDYAQWMLMLKPDGENTWMEGAVDDGSVAIVFDGLDDLHYTVYVLDDQDEIVPVLDDPAPIVESMQPVTDLKQLQSGKILVDKMTKAQYDIEAVDMTDPKAFVLDLVKQATPDNNNSNGLYSTKTVTQKDLRSTRLYIK